IAEIGAWNSRRFMNLPNLQPGTIGIHVGHVQRVAVAEARRVHTASVVVDHCRTVDNFVLAIEIDVGHAQVVISLAFVVRLSARTEIRVEQPALWELSIAKGPGGERHPGVVAASHHEAGAYAVEIGDPGEEAVDAIAITVAPNLVELAACWVLSQRVPRH